MATHVANFAPAILPLEDTMKSVCLALLLAAFTNAATSAEPRLYELQKFQAAPEKIDALHARLRDLQIPLLERYGIKTAGVFTPAGENPDRLVYVLVSADSLEDLIKGWVDFRNDPEWKKALAEDAIVTQATRQTMRTAYWSPPFTPEKAAEPRVFELRTYTCPDRSKQVALCRRFRDHTMKLFEKYGMVNLIYWEPEDDNRMLVYLLAHRSEAAAKESFAAFRADPDWLAAKKASEEAAGGSLTEKENGVVSQFLEATDYSPLK
jgi:hypothetical protein